MKHFYEENTPYFITCVTFNRNEIFRNGLGRDLLSNILIYNKFKCKYNIYSFVIMPDHFHLILQPLGEMNISEIMKKIKGNFSRFYNIITGSSGTVLQKGFYDEAIRSEGQLKETMEYIHNNPLKANIVSNLDEYEYSSYGYFHNDDERFELLLKNIDV